MEFAVPERVREIQRLVREFMDTEVLPLEPSLRQKSLHDLLPVLREARARARQTGLFAAHMPEALGGAGLSLLEFAFMSEELGRSPLGHYVFNCQAPDVGNMEILAHHGTPEQQDRFLRPLVAGELRSCFTMTEAELAGSNPVWLATTAVREGDHYVLNGPTLLPGNLTRLEVVARYAERTARAVDDVLFYYVFALLKIAVIAQQIYRRFKDGHSRDPRFAAMLVGVRILGATASRALERGRMDRLG